MSPAVIRLVLLNGAGAWRRFAAIVAGIAIGVALLFTLLGANAGLQARDARTWWTNLDARPAADDAGVPIPLTDSTALVSGHVEMFRGAPIWQLDVALTPASQVRLPGDVATPPAGGTLASPALVKLIDRVPPDQLGDRFGTVVGELPATILTGPDRLMAIQVTDEATLRARAKVWLVDDFGGIQPSTAGTYSLMLIIGSVALIIPVILLVNIVTQLGAAQRRERLQVLRLIGATPRTVAGLIAAEMALMAAAGSLAGLGLFYLVRPLAAQVRVDTTGFYPTDLTVSAGQVAAVSGLVIAASTLTAVWGVHRQGIGPLGVSRQNRESQPRWWRWLPLAAGTAALATAAFGGLTTDLRQYLAVGGFAGIAAGIVIAGPVLVHQLGGWLARRGRTAAGVVTANWFRRHPAAAFRSVSGLVIALFLVTVFSGMASVATLGLHPVDRPGLMPPDMAEAVLVPGADVVRLRAQLSAVEGVTGIVFGSALPGEEDVSRTVVTAADARALGFPDAPAGGCAVFVFSWYTDPVNTDPVQLEPTDCTPTEPNVVFVSTAGGAAMERDQTRAAGSPLLATALATRVQLASAKGASQVNALATMAYLGVVIAIVIAGISLAVSSAAAVIDNKRTFSLMRLMGMPRRVLWQVVAGQAVGPLVVTVVGTISLGFAVVWAMIAGWSDGLALSWPDPRYYLAIAAATLVAVLAVVASFPVVAASTGTETTRFE